MPTKLGDQQAATRLRSVAESTLRQFELLPEKSLDKFMSIVFGSSALKRALALNYLTPIAAGLAGGAGAGQQRVDTQLQNARPESSTGRGQDDTEPQKLRASSSDAGGGQKPGGIQLVDASSSTPSPAPVPAKRLRHRRTIADIEAARRASMVSTDAILRLPRFGMTKAFGDIYWNDLVTQTRRGIERGIAPLAKSTSIFEDVLLGQKLIHHYPNADSNQKVKDVVKPTVLKRFVDEARVEAPMKIANGMKILAKVIEGSLQQDVLTQ